MRAAPSAIRGATGTCGGTSPGRCLAARREGVHVAHRECHVERDVRAERREELGAGVAQRPERLRIGHRLRDRRVGDRALFQQLLQPRRETRAVDRLVGAKLVADEGSRSLWLLPEGDTDWLAEFVQDPARVMARAIGLRLEREMGVPAATTPVCEAQSSPTEETQRFLVTMGGSKRPLVFGEEQGTFKLLEYAFRPETGRSFLDPKPASKKKWTPKL